MTLWDIYDAWTDTALDAPARDNGTHAERIEELKGYVDGCSGYDCWDCAPLTDEEAEKIVNCYEHGGAGTDELKEINHVRTRLRSGILRMMIIGRNGRRWTKPRMR